MSAAADLLARFGALSKVGQAKAMADAAAIIGKRRWIPQEGPQTDAYFSQADEVLFGGSVGGGKSDLLLGLALNEAHNAVIFRDGFGNVRDLEHRAIAILGSRDGFNSQTHFFALGDDRSLEFGSLEMPGSELSWQGRRRDFMGFDEVTQQSRQRVQFVQGWAGSAKPGARTRIVYATNPPLSDEGNWIVSWFAPWLDPMYPRPAKPGELRWFVNDGDGDPVWQAGPGDYDRGDGTRSTAKSRTFIPSRLADNAYLRDTDYRSRVEATPEPLRSALLTGNFMAARKDDAWQVIPSDWIRAAQARWDERGRAAAMIAMGVDVAQGGKDRTAIARLHAGNWFDAPIEKDGIDTRDGPAVAGLVVQHQRHGAPIGIDMTGGWGGDARTQLKSAEVDVVPVVFSGHSGAVDPHSRRPYANLRTEMHWEMRNALNPQSGENIALPPSAALLAEAACARWTDKGGKIAVESKDDIRARLGSSPDLWDAYLIAWHIRARGIRKQAERRGVARPRYAADDDPLALNGY